MSDWVKVTERLPKDGEKVLASKFGGIWTAVYKPNCTCSYKWHSQEREIPTHWQPLPAPPQE